MTTPPPPDNHNNHKRRRTLLWVTGVILFLGLCWLLLWFFYLQYHESTDDAYVNGNMINITPVIPGTPIAFYADDTDLVEEGQLLVQLDTTEYQVIFDQELANLASTVLNVRQLYENVKNQMANVEGKHILLNRAHYDYDNRSKLIGNLAVSNEDFIHSKDDFNTADVNLRQAEYQLQIAQAAAGNTLIEEHPQIESQKAKVRDAYYKLKHCSLYAPATGYVAQRAVEVGQWVTPTTPLMAVIPIDYMWVDANFKETQLTYMRIGQPAEVTFDIYGGSAVYKGKVLGIASGTGSVFSLIPPQNATGNWIKIVQRLPVRISVDPVMMKKFPLRIGLSANVDVNITETELPMLAQTTSKKPIGITDVYNINFDELEKLINKVINDNLAKTEK